ncbi:3-oxoacyl-[acyl-carrier-protein] reductase FabG [Lachnospiraceae bacterium]|jgi:NAD(P)-dependent dehydrogenase (short-subunit alcohol dehydrogenase family)|nr:3-oxoacyl-[acyl-carrier-protein] reductase FabG [Lachnospiraceae bacterium]
MINPMDLTGKIYLVTGASAGLGRQACITLSQLGAKVILLARNEKKLQESLGLLEGSGHSCYAFDLNKVEELEKLVKKIISENGSLDGFVHCAGIEGTNLLSKTTYDFMQEVMRVNVFSFIEIVRVITKRKNYNAEASIVAISSIMSIRGEKAEIAYCTSKGALDSAVMAMAMELGEKKKIRVNTVNPGWIKTNMYDKYVETFGGEAEEKLKCRQFLGVADPIDVSNVIAFLLSSAAAKITGQSIVVDGGWTVN